MKMATTKFGHKLHLFSSRPDGATTICGRDRYRVTKIKTPPAIDTCQVCVRSCVSQLRRIFGDELPELDALAGLDRRPA